MSEVSKRKQLRSLELGADFVDGFAEGWHFAVGEFFRDELDIKLTERVEKGVQVLRWTQGPYYAFKEGHILYDTPKAYLQWSEAIKHIKRMIMIVRATPNRPGDDRSLVKGTVTFRLSRPKESKRQSSGRSHYVLQIRQDG